MSEVTVKINNRGYGISCDAGQEQRLSDLASYVDSRLQDIAAAGAASNDSHLFVLTSLVLADEIYDLQDRLNGMQEQLRHLQAQQAPGAVSAEDEMLIAQAIEHLAAKIEHIASRVDTKRLAHSDDDKQHA